SGSQRGRDGTRNRPICPRIRWRSPGAAGPLHRNESSIDHRARRPAPPAGGLSNGANRRLMATIFRARATGRCRRPLASHVRTFYMSWSREGGRSGPRGYHHGNLKEALIRAALELIAQKGPAGFTFAEAARWAGVSPAAPYRHFRDRDELLIDVARRGFDQFEVTLARAWDGGRPDAFTAFERVGKAYLRFAKSEPAYYSAMFEAGIPPEASPQLQEAGQRAFAVLRTATEQLIATMPAQQRPPVLMMTLH